LGEKLNEFNQKHFQCTEDMKTMSKKRDEQRQLLMLQIKNEQLQSDLKHLKDLDHPNDLVHHDSITNHNTSDDFVVVVNVAESQPEAEPIITPISSISITTPITAATSEVDKDNKDEVKEMKENEEEGESKGLIEHNEKELEEIQTSFSKMSMEKLSVEKEMTRLKDMMLLQQQTLQSLDESKMMWMSQKQELKVQINELELKIKQCSQWSSHIQFNIKKWKEDTRAIEDALTNLSLKKTQLVQKLKKNFGKKKKEKAEELKILQRNNINLKARQSQLLQLLEDFLLVQKKYGS